MDAQWVVGCPTVPGVKFQFIGEVECHPFGDRDPDTDTYRQVGRQADRQIDR